VIGDFGLAESVYADEYTFTRCGTPGFVAPEVANIKQENTKYTTACDLFSVGVIFHMLLLKRSPFPGVDDNVILRQNRICNFHF
jgi:serine/threonine protein kinase